MILSQYKRLGAVLLTVLLGLDRPLMAEVVFDGSLGPPGSLPATGGVNFRILQNYGQTAGSNLFHSFSRFNIGFLQSATFEGSAAIDNIFARVTGGMASTIDGLLLSAVPSANLWLINPSGVQFGPHASINVDGSFYVSSASYLKFNDGVRFGTDLRQTQVLTSAAPEAFGFIGDNPAAISLFGSGSNQARDKLSAYYAARGLTWNDMRVPEGKTLAVVGGDIRLGAGQTFDGAVVSSRLLAPAGRLEIVSVDASGEIDPGAPQVETTAFAKLGQINLAEGALVDASGSGGGEIVIRGGELTMNNAYLVSDTRGADNGKSINVQVRGNVDILNNGAGLYARSFGSGDAPDMKLDAQNIHLDNQAILHSVAGGVGNGGDVSVKTNVLSLSSNSQIVSEKGDFSSGSGGDIKIEAGELILADTSQIRSDTGNFNSNDGGDISINANQATINGGSSIQSNTGLYGIASGGDMTLNIDEALLIKDGSTTQLSGIFSNAVDGNAGTITLHAKTLLLQNGAMISGDSFNNGNGADIFIEVGDIRLIGNPTTLAQISSKSFAALGGVADGGNIEIQAQSINLDGVGSGIATSTLSNNQLQTGNITLEAEQISLTGGKIGTLTLGAGNAGSIQIYADDIELNNGASVESKNAVDIAGIISSGQGNTGLIRIVADSVLTVSNDGSVSTLTASQGRTGDISLAAENMSLQNGSQITAISLDNGATGDISIEVGQNLSMNGKSATATNNSGIYNNTLAGDAGNLRVRAKHIQLANGGEIGGSTSGKGHAADIEVSSETLLIKEGGSVESSSIGEGDAGNIKIAATKSIALENQGAILSNAFNTGDGGEIVLQAPNISLSQSKVEAATNGAGLAGDITIDVDNLSLSDGALLNTSTSGDGKGGDIAIDSERITLQNSVVEAGTSSSASAGDIDIHTGNLTLTENSQVNSQNFINHDGTPISIGQGDGGKINIAANQSIDVSNSVISSSTASRGQAGDVTLQAGQRISVSRNGFIGSSSLYQAADDNIGQNGAAGDVALAAGLISASDSGRIDAGTRDGQGGAIEIKTNSLQLGQGGNINTSTEGKGRAGSIQIRGQGEEFADQVTINGVDDDLVINDYGQKGQFSGIYLNTAGSGDGGSLSLKAKHLDISDGGVISAVSAFSAEKATQGGDIDISTTSTELTGGGLISAATSGLGKAGNIRLTALEKLTVSGRYDRNQHPGVDNPRISDRSGINNSATYALDKRAGQLGAGGSIEIKAGRVSLSNGGEISVANAGDQAENVGGSINIDAGERLDSQDGSISAETASARGGDINLKARKMIHLIDSKISTSVAGGSGSGGNIFIDPQFVILDHSQIIAQAQRGAGGNIHIAADQFIQSPDSLVSASSAFGVDGNVVISSPDTNLIGKIATLSAKFIDPASLFKQSCEARYVAGPSSSLSVQVNTVEPAPGETFLDAPLSLTQKGAMSVESTNCLEDGF